jgi:hypothetical protein
LGDFFEFLLLFENTLGLGACGRADLEEVDAGREVGSGEPELKANAIGLDGGLAPELTAGDVEDADQDRPCRHMAEDDLQGVGEGVGHGGEAGGNVGIADEHDLAVGSAAIEGDLFQLIVVAIGDERRIGKGVILFRAAVASGGDIANL